MTRSSDKYVDWCVSHTGDSDACTLIVTTRTLRLEARKESAICYSALKQ